MSPLFPRSSFFHAIPTVLSLGLVLASAPSLNAQSSGVQGTAEREILRRQQVTAEFAPSMIQKGDAAMAAKDYESAFSLYRAAVDALPLGGQNVQSVREKAMKGFTDAAVSLAKQRISEGRFADAEEIVKVFLKDYDPNSKPVLALEAQLRDPQAFNRAITPKYVADVEEVKRLLIEADGFYQSGRYDLAFKRYEQVLNVDKYNIAARRGMEKVNAMRQRYSETAYNESRSSMLTEVSKGWELPPRRYDLGVSTIIEQPVINVTGSASISKKLNDIIIPKIEFRETTVREAIDFIKARAAALDTNEPDPTRRGVNIVLKLDPAAQAAESMTRITLSLNDLPLRAVLDYVAAAAGLKVKVEPYAVAIVPLTEPTEVLITKEYKVPPSFLNMADTGAGATTTTFGAGGAGGGTRQSRAKEYLESQGVTFPEGASAQYLPSSSKLIVRNTPSNLELIDSLVEISLATPPTQINIESKFLEVTQNNLQELGLDWLIGQFALPAGSGIYGSGGTSGNQGNTPSSNYPLGTGTPFVPIGANSVDAAGNVRSGQLTAGTRSGQMAIRANAVDALLFASPAGPAPGVLALAGVFTKPQFQVVLRALDQAKGVDLMSAPSVTTKSGQSAKIQIIREFIYPASYSAPQIPTEQAVGAINPATPSIPEDWAMEPVGVELEVEPIIGPDGFSIELNLRPKVTEFEGFIDYGSPISTSAPVFNFVGGALATIGTQSVVLTNNVINQPVFSFREVTTNVTIYDGQTVALGGLIREDVQKVEDKVPILGDIPIAGRLFRTSSNQQIKRNLIIFVTANLIDPSGKPLLKEVDDDLALPVTSEPFLKDEILPGDAASMAPQL